MKQPSSSLDSKTFTSSAVECCDDALENKQNILYVINFECVQN